MSDEQMGLADNNVVADKVQEILYQYVTKEEISSYEEIGKKILAADNAIKNFVKTQISDKQEQKEDDSSTKGPLPHFINITVVLDVLRSDSKNSLPYQIVQDKRNYEIDFIADAHDAITEGIFEQIQDVIETKCKQLPGIID